MSEPNQHDARPAAAPHRIGDQLLTATVLLGLGAFVIAHALVAVPPRSSTWLHWLPVLNVLLLPHGRTLLRKLSPSNQNPRAFMEILLLAAQVVPIALWPIGAPAARIAASIALLLGNLLSRPRRLRGSAWMLATSPTLVLLAMAALPHTIWLWYLPLTLLTSSAALVFLSARVTEERLLAGSTRSLANIYSKSFERALDGHEIRRRLRSSMTLALALSVLICSAYPLLFAIPRPEFELQRLGLGPSARELRERAGRELAEQAAASGVEYFPGDIRPGGVLGGMTYETVMTITARSVGDGRVGEERRAPVNAGTLYLRALCLDTFSDTGLRSSRRRGLKRLFDDSDGTQDGWIELQPWQQPAEFELEVRQSALRIPRSNEIVLFVPQMSQAIDLPQVRYDPDRMLALPVSSDAADFAYRLRLGPRNAASSVLSEQRALHRDGRFTQLPAESPDLAWLRQRAREVVRGAASDLERVAYVLEHFQQGFDYSTKTIDVPGLAGIVNFMRREKGHCTSFAATAALLLRTLDIPARVATGFLAEDFDPSTGSYKVSRRDGHAWIEVYFEDAGWQTFDATPRDMRVRTLRLAENGDDEGLASWSAELQSDLEAWARSGGEQAYLDQILATLADGPRALGVSLRDSPWLLVLPLTAALTLILLRKRRRLAWILGIRPAHQVREELLQSLLSALAARGHHRARHQSLREFQRSLPTSNDSEQDNSAALFEELGDLLTLFDRDAFGGRPLDPQEILRVRSWTQRFRARARPTPAN